MQYESVDKNAQKCLIGKFTEEFVRSIRLIDKLSNEIYPKIGAHFRHNLDFANAFLNGLAAGKLDYEKRERDETIEQNRSYAIEQIGFLIRRFQDLAQKDLEKEVSVRSEIDADVWHKSSAMRELEFLLSHTIHHHALVAEKLNNSGVKIAADFGVAPSTLKFWAAQKKAA